MAAIFSTRFVESRLGAGGDFQIPAGQVGVVRSITVANTGTSATEWWTVYIKGPGTVLASGLLHPFTSPDGPSSTVIDLRAVLKAGETVSVFTQPAIDVVVSGYLFAS